MLPRPFLARVEIVTRTDCTRFLGLVRTRTESGWAGLVAEAAVGLIESWARGRTVIDGLLRNDTRRSGDKKGRPVGNRLRLIGAVSGPLYCAARQGVVERERE